MKNGKVKWNPARIKRLYRDKVIQVILRHARVETTAAHYIVVERQTAGRKAMRQLEGAIRRAKIGKQVANSNVSKPRLMKSRSSA